MRLRLFRALPRLRAMVWPDDRDIEREDLRAHRALMQHRATDLRLQWQACMEEVLYCDARIAEIDREFAQRDLDERLQEVVR